MSIIAAQFLVTHAVLVFISRYTPKTIEIEHKLQPFIPEFIPAVGDIDAFLKVQFLQLPLSVLPDELKQCRVRACGQSGRAGWVWSVPALSDMAGRDLENYPGGLVTCQTALG